jgi:uridine kinase
MLLVGTSMPGKVFIVGLAGPSGSGKSTVARRVGSRLNGQVISMEIYATEVNHLPVEERARQNYDAPQALDVELLESHIRKYAAGLAIEAPIYDFAQHLRVSGRRQPIPAKPLLIVEGILALHFAQLRPHFDLSIYLDAPNDVCFHRRKVRGHYRAPAATGTHPVAIREYGAAGGAAVPAAQQALRGSRIGRQCGPGDRGEELV